METEGGDASQALRLLTSGPDFSGRLSRENESNASSSTQFTTSQDEDDDVEVQPSPLELARACGFCSSFMLEDPLYAQALTVLPWTTEHDIDDPKDAPSVTNMRLDDLLVERLEITLDAALVLQKVMLPNDNRLPLEGLPEVKFRKKLTIEPPLLLSDHEMDMKWFCHSRRTGLAGLTLPLEHIDNEQDEGMEWPPHFSSLPNETMQKLGTERLEVPRDVVKYLQDLVKDEADDTEHHQFDGQDEAYLKRTRTEPISPPLMPVLSPPLAPFDPSSETGELLVLSDGGESITMEVARLDLYLQSADGIKPSNLKSSDQPDISEIEGFASIYTPLQSDLSSTTSLPHKRKIRDMAMDVPLIASDGSASSSEKKRKTVAFADDLCMYMPDSSRSRPLHELASESEASLDAFIKECIEPTALEAEKAAQQEQLVTADALQRIDVPVMDFSTPPTPWKTRSGVQSTKVKLINTADAWSDELEVLNSSLDMLTDYAPFKISAKEERQLKQYPFDAKLGEVPREPAIDDTRYVAVIMSDLSLEDVVTTDTLVWKPEGLRVQRRLKYEIEEELEACSCASDDVVEGNDLQGLLWKRQKELLQQEHGGDSIDFAVAQPIQGSGKLALHVDSHRRTATPHPDSKGMSGTKMINASLISGCASASSLYALMVHMGHHAATPAQRTPGTETPRQATKNNPPKVTVEEPTRAETSEQVAPLALPSLPANPPHNAVVLSVSLVHNYRRTLKRVFKDFLSNTVLIERDFSSVQTAPEADILVSPGAGLILTNLQKIKQKPLPGQVGESNSIRERISKLALRYEMLIVLVGGALTPEVSPLDQRDGEALADFSAFCAQCSMDFQIMPIPAGEESMAIWIASTICEFGRSSQEPDLLQDETMWEQTLRRVGLNAYAAQTILALLKEDEHGSSSDPILAAVQDHGIRAFIKMTSEQRMSKFEGHLGGRNVLHRINKAIERKWLSQKTGYSTLGE